MNSKLLESASSVDTEHVVSPTEATNRAKKLLALLGDEYTQRVLAAIIPTPRTGREIVAATGVSKSTVYRRLDRLEQEGLVESDYIIDSNGHHRQQFSAAIDSIHIALNTSGFNLSLN